MNFDLFMNINDCVLNFSTFKLEFNQISNFDALDSNKNKIDFKTSINQRIALQNEYCYQ